MKRAAFFVVLALAFGSLGLVCPGPNPGPPPNDACMTPAAGGVDLLEVGPPTDTFTAWRDDVVVQTVTGGQGLEMLPVRLRVTGAGAPDCMDQRISIQKYAPDGTITMVGTNTGPVKTYVQPDGSRLTKPIFVVLSDSYVAPGDLVTISAAAAGKSTTVSVYANFPPAADAGATDAGTSD